MESISLKIKTTIITLVVFVGLAFGQKKEKVFEHLSLKEGLSQGTVFAIYQDSKGFMWFGTRTGGLNKYDGKSFKVYKQDPEDSTSIGGNERRIVKVFCGLVIATVD